MSEEIVVPELLKSLWNRFDFNPNPQQKAAILHTKGPLYLPAGPGSGKTQVLLWRTVNLIVNHGMKPEQIFLSTFTEKAALQLREGLRTLLGAASQINSRSYDIANIYVGTVHSLCQRLISDRRLSRDRHRPRPPILLDELGQYMFLHRRANWDALRTLPRGKLLTPTDINHLFGDNSQSRHEAISHLLTIFNRFSEEMIDPISARKTIKDPTLRVLLDLYANYIELLQNKGGPEYTDLSLLQRTAVDLLTHDATATSYFSHVIIDEYQDTNPVQERLFFLLARGHKNICVVGDDDQALYRFRGATVENFVNFPSRCLNEIGLEPSKIVLNTNYRSRKKIVDFYNEFITHDSCDWSKPRSAGFYRVKDKNIAPYNVEDGPAVVASTSDSPENVAKEIALLVQQLLNAKRVEDPNQIAFLFPSLKSPHVGRMQEALETVGLKVYAPRADTFLNVSESIDVFGLILQVFGDVQHYHPPFRNWTVQVQNRARQLMKEDIHLRSFVEQRRAEVKQAASDHVALTKILEGQTWKESDDYDPDKMRPILIKSAGISDRARKSLSSEVFDRFARQRLNVGKPLNLHYAINRATSLDWNVLDFFYQLLGFNHFKRMLDLAEDGKDEGPICNLSLISQYLGRFVDTYPFPVSGSWILKDQFLNIFSNYLYVLFRRQESEYEDSEDPFPKGRIPFITIHQAKGLEFPVVVLANPRKDPKTQKIEEMVAPLLSRESEPPDRIPLFDVMRMFYVALSRPKNLLVISHFVGRGQRQDLPIYDLLNNRVTRIPKLDVSTVPYSKLDKPELPKTYSYTADFLLYRKCPRQYMIFREYGFVPSRSQTMFFGSLVHQTLDDLHQRLIGLRDRQ